MGVISRTVLKVQFAYGEFDYDKASIKIMTAYIDTSSRRLVSLYKLTDFLTG